MLESNSVIIWKQATYVFIHFQFVEMDSQGYFCRWQMPNELLIIGRGGGKGLPKASRPY